MKQSIRELRLARGWTQQKMAEKIDSTPQRVSDLERGRFGASDEEIAKICARFDCEPSDLLLDRARPKGRPSVPGGELLRPFLISPLPVQPERSSASRLSALWRDYPNCMRQVEKLLPSWMPFLDSVESDSDWETLHHLRELFLGAAPTQVTGPSVGFDRWPICDWRTGSAMGHRPKPALVTRDWLIIYQLGIVTRRRRYRLDGLLVVRQPLRTILAFEVDNPGHDLQRDATRRKAHGLLELRIPSHEVWTGPSVSERLRNLDFGKAA